MVLLVPAPIGRSGQLRARQKRQAATYPPRA